jgi:hypothetical protein
MAFEMDSKFHLIELFMSAIYECLYKAKVFVATQDSLMFVGKARSLPFSGALERFFTWVGSSLTHKH